MMSKRSRNDSSSSSDGDEADNDYMAAASPSKLVEIDQDSSKSTTFMHCDLPPHKEVLSFTTYEDYETHYSKSHTNRCSACGKNFPTTHFLTLHIEENHNPLREALAGRGEKTYGCFVEDCERKCSTAQKRRLHLIDKHMFPKGYNFRIVDKGIDQVDSMLSSGPRRRLSGFHDKQKTGHSVADRSHALGLKDTLGKMEQETPSTSAGHRRKGPPLDHPRNQFENKEKFSDSQPGASEVDQLGAAMSALQFVPPSVQQKKQSKG